MYKYNVPIYGNGFREYTQKDVFRSYIRGDGFGFSVWYRTGKGNFSISAFHSNDIIYGLYLSSI